MDAILGWNDQYEMHFVIIHEFEYLPSRISTWVRLIPLWSLTMEGGERNKLSSRRPQILIQGLTEYLTESALHGVKYLVGGGRKTKFFWVGSFNFTKSSIFAANTNILCLSTVN